MFLKRVIDKFKAKSSQLSKTPRLSVDEIYYFVCVWQRRRVGECWCESACTQQSLIAFHLKKWKVA
jgi:hypothetical protein